MTSLVLYQSSREGLIERGIELANTLLFHAYYLYDWLQIAPIILKAQLRQLGRYGIDQIPMISDQMKREIKQWLRDYFGI
jgi:hypothetical protein